MTLFQILIDRTTRKAMDAEGNALPTLVYMAREKRPQYFHNFKAGAMNALVMCAHTVELVKDTETVNTCADLALRRIFVTFGLGVLAFLSSCYGFQCPYADIIM